MAALLAHLQELHTLRHQQGPAAVTLFPVLPVEYSARVRFGDVVFQDRVLHLAAVTRFVNGNHFVTYVRDRTDATLWYLVDGIKGVFAPAKFTDDESMMGSRDFFFYSVCRPE